MKTPTNTDPKTLLAPILKSSEWKKWQADHAAAMAAAEEMRRRAEAFAEIVAEATLTLENREKADPRALIRASGDKTAAEAEQAACLERADELEAEAITASEAAAVCLEKASRHLSDLDREWREKLEAELRAIAGKFGLDQNEFTSPGTLAPGHLRESITSGPDEPSRIASLWYGLSRAA